MGQRGRPPYPETLTPRQQEVLELLREGMTNREIAEKLDISTDGAKWHVSEILARIGVTSRDEAARWAEGTRERAMASLDGRGRLCPSAETRRIPRWLARHRSARLIRVNTHSRGRLCQIRSRRRLRYIIGKKSVA
jgi:DNA-binding CsgD family transcriptional regulator